MVHWRLTMTVITCIYVQYVYIHRCIYFRHYACTPPQFFNGNFFVFILHSLMYFMWISWYSKKIHALKSKDLKAFDFDGNLIIIIKKKEVGKYGKRKTKFSSCFILQFMRKDTYLHGCSKNMLCSMRRLFNMFYLRKYTGRYTSFFKLDNILGKIAVVQFSW